MTHIIHKIASNARTICETYERFPKTFIMIRFLEIAPAIHQRSLCLYDWKFACIHVPQADVVLSISTLGRRFFSYSVNAELNHKFLLMDFLLTGCKKETIQIVIDTIFFQKAFNYSMMELQPTGL